MRSHEELERELRITRNQLTGLIERNADAILVVDDGGCVLFANAAAERLFRRGSGELLGSELGLPLVVGETTEIDIVGPRTEAGVAELRVVETEWNGASARLAVLRDITERKRSEQEREQLFREQTARLQAEKALRERDEFMALASHELKTPAATLSATAQLLVRQLERQGELGPDQLRRALDRLEEQSRRLARLIGHLMDLSRINSGLMQIDPSPVDLRRVVDDVVSTCQATTAHHTISVRGPAHLEAVVDSIRIEQVVTNLLDNAIKYSPSGGDIDVELSALDGDRACIAVRDHGIGIPEAVRDRLYERFYRVPNAHVSGLGLGLFITHHLVTLHGGSIQVDTPPDSGTRFTVTLPIRRSPA